MGGAGFDGMAMHVQQAEAGIERVGTAATELRSGWTSVHSSITGSAGRLGKGVLGAAFMGGYSAPAADLARQVDTGCESIDQLYTGARPAPAEYQESQVAGAAAITAAQL